MCAFWTKALHEFSDGEMLLIYTAVLAYRERGKDNPSIRQHQDALYRILQRLKPLAYYRSYLQEV